MTHRCVLRDTNKTLLTVLETDQPITHLAIGVHLVLHTGYRKVALEQRNTEREPTAPPFITACNDNRFARFA
jgi:hypothetical protein